MATTLPSTPEQVPVFAGSELLAFQVADMPPLATIYSYVNGVNITQFTGPTTTSAVIGDPIVTDQLGFATGFLYIPSTAGEYKFLTGAIRITFGDSPDGIDKCKYISETVLMNHGLNLVDTEQGGTIALRQMETIRADLSGTSGEASTTQTRLDPLSQTFEIDSSRYPLGIYVTAVTLFVYKKDDKLPLSIELRPMENGKPSITQYFSGSFSIKSPEDIGAYDEAAGTVAPTTFVFSHPIFLRPAEYAICVMTKSDKYQLFTAKNGDGKTVKQPFSGKLFKPQNTGEWIGDANEDIAFILSKAKFNTGTTTFTAKNQSVQEYEYTKLRLLSTEINFGDTAYVDYKVSTKTAGASANNDFVDTIPGTSITPDGRQVMGESGDLSYQISLTTKNPDVAPILDKQLLKAQIINNKVVPYSVDISNSELKASHGTARSRYISKVVALQDGFDSTGLEVKLDVNRKSGTDIEVFARVLSSQDNISTNGILAKPWVRLPLVQPAKKEISGSAGSVYFNETYRSLDMSYSTTSNNISNVAITSNYTDFSSYQIKVVFYASNPTLIPKIKNLIATSLL